jgi:hypothetical protein
MHAPRTVTLIQHEMRQTVYLFFSYNSRNKYRLYKILFRQMYTHYLLFNTG